MKWPLRKKFYLAFGGLLGLMLVLSLIFMIRMEAAADLEREQLVFSDIAYAAQSMQTTMNHARTSEVEFFSQDGDEAAEKAQLAQMARFEELSDAMKGKLVGKDEALKRDLEEARHNFKEYAHAFEVARDQFKLRGTAKSGLQLQFREAAHEIEEAAKEFDDSDLHITLLLVRRAEKDYLLRGDVSYRNGVNELIDRLQKYARTKPELSRVMELATDYRQKFNLAYEATLKLDERREALRDSALAASASLQKLQERANISAAEIRAAGDAARRDSQVMMILVVLVSISLALVVSRLLSSQLTNAVTVLMEATRRISAGELRVKCEVGTDDELGSLAQSFNEMAGSLSVMAKDINEATVSINQSVGELQATVSEQGAALQQQASSVSETVATVDEISRSSGQVTETASQVLASAGRSMDTSEEGRKAISLSVKGMQDVRDQVQNIATTILELSDKTQQIGGIIATVDDFAEQSSLLALNASIEAARAGENGKAFSVVAGEVKNLAEQSQRATERVRSILSDIQKATHTAVMVTEEGSKRVDRGVDLVNSAGEVIRQLAGAIGASSDSAKQIASAARQQTNGVEQITVAIAGIDQFARQNLEAVKQTEATAHNLMAIAKRLQVSVERYRA